MSCHQEILATPSINDTISHWEQPKSIPKQSNNNKGDTWIEKQGDLVCRGYSFAGGGVAAERRDTVQFVCANTETESGDMHTTFVSRFTQHNCLTTALLFQSNCVSNIHWLANTY